MSDKNKGTTINEQVEKLIKYNPEVAKEISEKPELKYKLQEICENNYDKYKGVIKGAQFIDKVDSKLGIMQALGAFLGPGVGYLATNTLRAAEEVLMKIPYSIYYTAKTKDYGALPGWLGSEAFATIMPFGDLVDVLPIYKNRAEKYLGKVTSDKFLEEIKNYKSKNIFKKKDEDDDLEYKIAA